MLIAFSAFLLALIARIIQINVSNGKKYEQRVLNQKNYDSLVVPFKRGDILDTNGTVLASSNKVYNLVIEPKNIIKDEENEQATVKALNDYFGITAEEMSEYLQDKNSLYKVVRKKLTYEEVKAFTDFQNTKEGKNVVGVWFEEGYERVYPNGELACHLLGFVVSGNEGIGGVEGSYNEYLNGENGRTYTYLNDDYNLLKTTEPARNGDTLITTIDAKVQDIVQENAEEYMNEIGAKNISVLVMDPKTCEILALYNAHQYDPNDAYSLDAIRYQFPELSDEQFEAKKQELLLDENSEEKIDALNEVWRNFIISDTFEPGSTYKTFTIAGAIEDGILNGSETFYCDGHQQVADYLINCHKREGHGEVTLSQALEKSCNDALMQIAAREGPVVFDKYQSLFGFGQRTNIDIAGEQSEAALASLIYHANTLHPVELATSSFGQGVTVTMMQLGTAFCSVINGGYYYEPHVVKQIVDENGNVIKNYDKILVRRTVSEQTSATMRDILFKVVDEGTGKKAGVEGYSIGGKTGTAEKLPRGNKKYILSFIGFAPAEDPQIMVYCIVDEPNVDDQSTSGAGSVLFKMIAEDLFPYLNIYKTNDNYDIQASDADDETPTPIYEGDIPANDVAGGGQATDSDAADDADTTQSDGADTTPSDDAQGDADTGQTGDPPEGDGQSSSDEAPAPE